MRERATPSRHAVIRMNDKFAIRFTDDPAAREDPRHTKRGEIVLGDHREVFVSRLDTWGIDDYAQNWLCSARQLAAGEMVAFIVDAGRPNAGAWLGVPHDHAIVFFQAYLRWSGLRVTAGLVTLDDDTVKDFSDPQPSWARWMVERSSVAAFASSVGGDLS